jgi:hypothetical protein
LAAFAAAADLATRLGITLTAGETTDADTLLELASDIIRSDTGQTIDAVASDTLTRPGSWDNRIRLPERPVTDVNSVTLDGTALAETDEWYQVGDELVRVSGTWGGPEAVLVVDYDHGWATVPAGVKGVCLEMVARVWVNPGSVQQEGYGSEQVTYPAGNGLLPTDAELRTLDRIVRRGQGSMRLR